MRVEDVDLREVGDVGHVEDDAADRSGRLVEEIGNLVDEDAELARFRREEGIQGVCVVFGCVGSATDATVVVSICMVEVAMWCCNLLVKGDHNAPILRILRNGQSHSLEQI